MLSGFYDAHRIGASACSRYGNDFLKFRDESTIACLHDYLAADLDSLSQTAQGLGNDHRWVETVELLGKCGFNGVGEYGCGINLSAII